MTHAQGSSTHGPSKDGAPPTVEELTAQCQGLVRMIAQRVYAKVPRHLVDFDDLVSYGQVGLFEAAKNFDSSRGVKFSTFAYFRIRGAIYDGLALMAWFRRSTRRRQLSYEQHTNELLEEEVDDAGGPHSLSDEARWLRDITASLGLCHVICDGSGQYLQQAVASSEDSPNGASSRHELRDRLQHLIDGLPGQEGRLIRAAYYEGLSLTEAAREIGVSKSWASRMHSRTLKRLANLLRAEGITKTDLMTE